MPTLEHEVNLYYTEAGKGETILFCHGAAGNAASWFNQFGAFAKDCRCIAYDCRGFGRSVCTPAEFDASKFAADAVAVLDHLDVATATFVCQSMGGWTGVRAALDFPERVDKLVLSDTIGGDCARLGNRKRSGVSRGQWRARRVHRSEWICAEGPRGRIPLSAALGLQSAALRRGPRRDVRRGEPGVGRARADHHPADSHHLGHARRDLAAGGARGAGPAAAERGTLRDRLRALPHLENPGEFNRVLREFLARSPENVPR